MQRIEKLVNIGKWMLAISSSAMICLLVTVLFDLEPSFWRMLLFPAIGSVVTLWVNKRCDLLLNLIRDFGKGEYEAGHQEKKKWTNIMQEVVK